MFSKDKRDELRDVDLAMCSSERIYRIVEGLLDTCDGLEAQRDASQAAIRRFLVVFVPFLTKVATMFPCSCQHQQVCAACNARAEIERLKAEATP